jgi:hypothetical protein
MFDPVQEHSLDYAIRHEQWPLARFLAVHLQKILPKTITPLDLLFLLGLVCSRLGLMRFWDTHAGADLLCHVFDALLDTAETRQKKRLRSWGDTTHRRFCHRDLAQKLVTAEELPRSAYMLEQRVFQEALLAAHLLRGARRFGRRQQLQWAQYHQAAGIVLSRLLEVWLKLRKETSPCIAYTCLRWALRKVWQALFGAEAPLLDLLQEQDMPQWVEVETLDVMTEMARRGHTRTPEALAHVVAEWQRGNLPQRPPKHCVEWPEGDIVRFKV